MSSYTVKDLLKAFFEDAESVMAFLADKHGGEFTSQQFIKYMAQKKQDIYIEILYRCREHAEASPFNAAHQHIGNTLRSEAQKAGYEGPHRAGTTEIDVFGNPTTRVVYRQTRVID